MTLIVGVDCCFYDMTKHLFCGAPATYWRFENGSATPTAILCEQHRRPGDEPIPADVARAPRMQDRNMRYVVES